MVLKKGLNFIAGVLVLAGGALPFLSKLGVIGELPTVPKIVFASLLILGGLFLLLNSFGNDPSMGGPQVMPRKLNGIIGFVTLPLAILSLLGELGKVAFMAGVPGIIINGVLALAGFILVLDGILGISY
jgi:hypothetical protein